MKKPYNKQNPYFFLIMIILFGLLEVNLQAKGVIPSQISSALNTGNCDELAPYIIDELELVIEEHDNIYSKEEAITLIEKFFNRNIPNDFIILHEGGKSAYHYAIGNLKTHNGEYRVYFLLKENEGKEYIQQLRIESAK